MTKSPTQCPRLCKSPYPPPPSSLSPNPQPPSQLRPHHPEALPSVHENRMMCVSRLLSFRCCTARDALLPGPSDGSVDIGCTTRQHTPVCSTSRSPKAFFMLALTTSKASSTGTRSVPSTMKPPKRPESGGLLPELRSTAVSRCTATLAVLSLKQSGPSETAYRGDCTPLSADPTPQCGRPVTILIV